MHPARRAVLELAQWFSEHPQKRSIIFIAFGAEELGLLGSAALVDDPPFVLENVVAMINMDMIGRLKDTTLVVGGAGTSSVWKEMVAQKTGQFNLSPKFDDAGYGSKRPSVVLSQGYSCPVPLHRNA